MRRYNVSVGAGALSRALASLALSLAIGGCGGSTAETTHLVIEANASQYVMTAAGVLIGGQVTNAGGKPIILVACSPDFVLPMLERRVNGVWQDETLTACDYLPFDLEPGQSIQIAIQAKSSGTFRLRMWIFVDSVTKAPTAESSNSFDVL